MAKGKQSCKTKVSTATRVLEPNAAGIDIGATEIYVAVPQDRNPHPVRHFSTFTQDLQQLAAWLKECGVESVAMESPGVFWIPLFQILEDRGFRVCLVNARHVKNVPGRKDRRVRLSVAAVSALSRPSARVSSPDSNHL